MASQSSPYILHDQGCRSHFLRTPQCHNRTKSRPVSKWRHQDKETPRKIPLCPGRLQEGDPIQVFSYSFSSWMEGIVVKANDENYIDVEYHVGKRRFGKTLHVHSDELVITSSVSPLMVAPLPSPIALNSSQDLLHSERENESWLEADQQRPNTESSRQLQENGLRFVEDDPAGMWGFLKGPKTLIYSYSTDDWLLTLQCMGKVEDVKGWKHAKPIAWGLQDWQQQYLCALEEANAGYVLFTTSYQEKFQDLQKSALRWEAERLLERKKVKGDKFKMYILNAENGLVADQLSNMLRKRSQDYNFDKWKGYCEVELAKAKETNKKARELLRITATESVCSTRLPSDTTESQVSASSFANLVPSDGHDVMVLFTAPSVAKEEIEMMCDYAFRCKSLKIDWRCPSHQGEFLFNISECTAPFIHLEGGGGGGGCQDHGDGWYTAWYSKNDDGLFAGVLSIIGPYEEHPCKGCVFNFGHSSRQDIACLQKEFFHRADCRFQVVGWEHEPCEAERKGFLWAFYNHLDHMKQRGKVLNIAHAAETSSKAIRPMPPVFFTSSCQDVVEDSKNLPQMALDGKNNAHEITCLGKPENGDSEGIYIHHVTLTVDPDSGDCESEDHSQKRLVSPERVVVLLKAASEPDFWEDRLKVQSHLVSVEVIVDTIPPIEKPDSVTPQQIKQFNEELQQVFGKDEVRFRGFGCLMLRMYAESFLDLQNRWKRLRRIEISTPVAWGVGEVRITNVSLGRIIWMEIMMSSMDYDEVSISQSLKEHLAANFNIDVRSEGTENPRDIGPERTTRVKRGRLARRYAPDRKGKRSGKGIRSCSLVAEANQVIALSVKLLSGETIKIEDLAPDEIIWDVVEKIQKQRPLGRGQSYSIIQGSIVLKDTDVVREVLRNGNDFHAVATNVDSCDIHTEKRMLERALKNKEHLHGPDHPEVASTLVELANAHGLLDDARTMELMLERALKIQERHYGPDHPEVASTLVNLAKAHGSLGDFYLLQRLLERALKIQEQHYGSHHPEVASTLVTSAQAHGSFGYTHKQKEILTRALRIQEQHYGPNHPTIASTLVELAKAYGSDNDRMMLMLREALKIQEQHYGPDHPEVASTLVELANAHSSVSDAPIKKNLLEKALKVQEQHYGPEHPKVASTLVELANAHGSLDDAHTLQQMLERALTIQEQHYGPDHPDVASTLVNMANAKGSFGDIHTEKRMLERALQIQEEHYGPDHHKVASTLVSLANAHGSLDDTSTMQRMLERALEIQERHYGPDHPEVASTLVKLANVPNQ